MSNEVNDDHTQPMPNVNDEEFVQDLVMKDIEERKQMGIRKYGTALQPFNGRKALQDAYEECLDMAMYLKQEILERERLTEHPYKKERSRLGELAVKVQRGEMK